MARGHKRAWGGNSFGVAYDSDPGFENAVRIEEDRADVETAIEGVLAPE